MTTHHTHINIVTVRNMITTHRNCIGLVITLLKLVTVAGNGAGDTDNDDIKLSGENVCTQQVG